jgi:hypothetical protein
MDRACSAHGEIINTYGILVEHFKGIYSDLDERILLEWISKSKV